MLKLREETTHAKELALCKDKNLQQIKQQILAHSETMGKWVTDYIPDVRKFLSRIAAYRDKKYRAAPTGTTRLLPQFFVFNHQNYFRYLTYHHFEIQALKHNNSSTYEQLKAYGIGASLTGRKFWTIPGDAATDFTIN